MLSAASSLGRGRSGDVSTEDERAAESVESKEKSEKGEDERATESVASGKRRRRKRRRSAHVERS